MGSCTARRAADCGRARLFLLMLRTLPAQLTNKSKLTRLAFNPTEPLLLVGDAKCVSAGRVGLKGREQQASAAHAGCLAPLRAEPGRDGHAVPARRYPVRPATVWTLLLIAVCQSVPPVLFRARARSRDHGLTAWFP